VGIGLLKNGTNRFTSGPDEVTLKRDGGSKVNATKLVGELYIMKNWGLAGGGGKQGSGG